MIKQYEQMQKRVREDENALVVLKIVQKAKLFDATLLCNEGVVTMLIDTPQKEKISPELLTAMGEIFNWIGKVEQNAQMS